MPLAIDIKDGQGPSNEYIPSYSQRLRKGYLAIYIAAKGVICTVITNKMEHFIFKSGCVIWVAKCLKED